MMLFLRDESLVKQAFTLEACTSPVDPAVQVTDAEKPLHKSSCRADSCSIH